VPIKEFREKTFVLKMDRGGLVREDLRFVGCTFDNCGISLTNDPARRSRAARLELKDCISFNCVIGPAHFEDVTVENLRTGDIQIVWGALFERVTLRGKIGSLKVNTSIQDPRKTPAQQAAFDRLRKKRYAKVDWALDISQCKPLNLELQGIPSERLILDPATQIVVSRERLHDLAQLEKLRDLDRVTRFVLESFRAARPRFQADAATMAANEAIGDLAFVEQSNEEWTRNVEQVGGLLGG